MKWDVKAKSVFVWMWDVRNVLSVEDYDCGKIIVCVEDELVLIDVGVSVKVFNLLMLYSLAFYRGETSEENVLGFCCVVVFVCGDGLVIVFDIDYFGVSGGLCVLKGKKKLSFASVGSFVDGRVECVCFGVDGVRGYINVVMCVDFVFWNRMGDVIVFGGVDCCLLVWNWVDEASYVARGLFVASIECDCKINDFVFVVDFCVICVVDMSLMFKLFVLC